MTLHHNRQRSALQRTPLVLAAVVAFAFAVVSSVRPATAQDGSSVLIRIAGPSVTYVVQSCPAEALSEDGATYGVNFVTTMPDGSTETSSGVRTADRQYSLTSDVRPDRLEGQYTAAATCVTSDGTVLAEYAPAWYWVVDGTPTGTPPDEQATDPSNPVVTATSAPDSPGGDPVAPGDDGSASGGVDSNDGNDDGQSNGDDPATTAPDGTGGTTNSGTDPDSPSASATPSSDENPTSESADDQILSDTELDTSAGGSPQPSPTAASQTGPAITTVQASPTEASAGTTVTTWVHGCPESVDGTLSAVRFSVTSPSGSVKTATSTKPSSDGSFSVAIRVPETPELGVYTISAGCGLPNGDDFQERRVYDPARFEVLASVGLAIPTATPVAVSGTIGGTPAAQREDPGRLPQRPDIGFTG